MEHTHKGGRTAGLVADPAMGTYLQATSGFVVVIWWIISVFGTLVVVELLNLD